MDDTYGYDYESVHPTSSVTSSATSSMPSRERRSSSKKKRIFCLKSQEEDFIYKPEERRFSFYQICQFSIDDKHRVRKIIYDEFGEMVEKREKWLAKERVNKFLKKCPKYKYTIYPSYDLDVVGYPEDNEILTAKSQILNDYNY
jgi:hypothetical protein